MKKLFQALALSFLLALAGPMAAFAGQISIQSQRTTDPTPHVYTITLPDADLDRLITAWGPVLYPTGLTPSGQPITGADIFNRLAERVVSDVKSQTESYLKSQAAAAASAAVPALAVTPVQ